MNLFDKLSLDQLHTLATALGNTIARLEERIDEAPVHAMKDYLARCQDDAAALLDEAEVAFDVLLQNSSGSRDEMSSVCRCTSTSTEAAGPVTSTDFSTAGTVMGLSTDCLRQSDMLDKSNSTDEVVQCCNCGLLELLC